MGLGLDCGTVIRGNVHVLDLSALAFRSNVHRRPVYTIERGDSFTCGRSRAPEAVEPSQRHHASPMSNELTRSKRDKTTTGICN
jgi:hypothetical protein